MTDLLSQLSDFESQERTLGNHEGADILLDARVALEQAQVENQAADLTKAIEAFAAVSDSLTLREIVETSDFPAAIKSIERLSSEGELLRAVEKAARELYPWLGTTAADGVDPNLYLRLQYALDAVSEELPANVDKCKYL